MPDFSGDFACSGSNSLNIDRMSAMEFTIFKAVNCRNETVAMATSIIYDADILSGTFGDKDVPEDDSISLKYSIQMSV